MDELTFWIIVAVVVSGIGSMFWWGLVAFGAYKIARLANQQVEQQLQQALLLGQQLQSLPPRQRAAAGAQMSVALSSLSNHMSQLDDLRRQQYDVRMGELAGMAAQAGIDWQPPS